VVRDIVTSRDGVVAGSPLSAGERQRRCRERKKAGSGVRPDGSWEPEFSGQRPPFAAGNGLSTTSGFMSPRRVRPLAERIAADLLAAESTPDYLRDGSYGDAIRSYATVEATSELLLDWVSGQDIGEAMTELSDGEESERRSGERVRRSSSSRRMGSALDYLMRCQHLALRMRSELGLTPLARARLGRDVAASRVDLARLWAAEDAAVAAGDVPGGMSAP